MSALFRLTPQAIEDLDSIWWFIAADSIEGANRVEAAIFASCRRLAGCSASADAILPLFRFDSGPFPGFRIT
jgi:plasmid stabilization system protein ParE